MPELSTSHNYCLSDFSYALPHDRIAQTPLARRDQSKMLVIDEDTMVDRHFYDLPSFLRAGDCLVINETRVIPARLIGQGKGGGAAELLLLKRRDLNSWETLCKPGKKLKPGYRLSFGPSLTAVMGQRLEDGVRLVHFEYDGVFETILERLGDTPLPPYITEKLEDSERYQTVYARFNGSAAAPTAGLHFTPDLLESIASMGVSIASLTLHVGLGTFRPVREKDLSKHHMHQEHYIFPDKAAETIRRTRESGGRIIAVGTTTARVLETVAKGMDPDDIRGTEGDSNLFIRPGFSFKLIDGLITNFHLPQSTLLMLVAAFIGYSRIMTAYRHAVDNDYRFFSFGDAMLLLPKAKERK